ncbi:site-specific integrase [Siphonobacter sp. BAB-5405]|uniref:tyrosine-type recombinase/integrase n=1 Tax=Siphonobacter sp. BAB-5405 TaxID=1864825 RepID=UPI001E2F1586|nr:site-specific integrase [Siphonobacter sp. BAB-5405]
MNAVSVNLSFDTLKDHRVSVKIRITFKREQRKYALPNAEPVIVSKAVYAKIVLFHTTGNLRVSEEVRQQYFLIRSHLDTAKAIIEKLSPFDFKTFKILFSNSGAESTSQKLSDSHVPSNGNPLNIHARFKLLKEKEYALGSIKNGNLCISASQSLIRFQKGADQLLFTDITPEFLEKYESWMLKYGKASKKQNGKPLPASINTVNIYTRQIRKAFNSAIKDKIISENAYPFKSAYVIPSEEGNPKALELTDIEKIFKYEAEAGSTRQRSKDLWILTYLSNGINMKDLCMLRWHQVNLITKEITFKRQKTLRTRKERQKDIIVNLHDESIEIFKRWGTPYSPNEYVFPFLSDDMDESRKRSVIDSLISVTNNHLSIIAKEVGISIKLRTYEARHSFATVLLQSESVPLYFISDALGHTTFSTTERYLGRFSKKQNKKYVANLLPNNQEKKP